MKINKIGYRNPPNIDDHHGMEPMTPKTTDLFYPRKSFSPQTNIHRKIQHNLLHVVTPLPDQFICYAIMK